MVSFSFLVSYTFTVPEIAVANDEKTEVATDALQARRSVRQL